MFGDILDRYRYCSTKNKTMSKDKFITGLLLGAAAGAVAGILFAPDKGSETRKRIVKQVEDIKGNIMEQVETVSGKILDTGRILKEKYVGVLNQGNEMPGKLPAPKMGTLQVKDNFSS
jgi:hypothetical protein